MTVCEREKDDNVNRQIDNALYIYSTAFFFGKLAGIVIIYEDRSTIVRSAPGTLPE